MTASRSYATGSWAAVAGLALISATALAATGSPDKTRSVDAIALYAQGAAVVQDSQTLDLTKGAQTVDWPAAGAVDADSLWLSGEGVRMTGFQMMNNGQSGHDALAVRIGQSVTLADNDKTRQGTLMSVNGDTAYVQVDGRMQRITAGSSTQLSWPISDNDELADSPRPSPLRLHLTSAGAGQKKLTATYQMTAPSWRASYTGRFDPTTNKLSLQANAIIDNSGRVALAADKAWLVAGNVSRAGSGHGPRPMMMARAKAESDSVGAPQASGAVYRYALANGLDVPAGAIQAVSLMKPAQFNAQRQYRFDHYALSDTGDTRSHAGVQLSFINNSGAPLPAGAIRVYNASGDARLMGGGRIGDTPKNAPVELSLGQAFDITGTHQIVEQSAADAKNPSCTVKITLYNAGKTDRNVTIAERLPEGATLAKDTPQAAGGTVTQPTWHSTVSAGGQQNLFYTLNLPSSQ